MRRSALRQGRFVPHPASVLRSGTTMAELPVSHVCVRTHALAPRACNGGPVAFPQPSPSRATLSPYGRTLPPPPRPFVVLPRRRTGSVAGSSQLCRVKHKGVVLAYIISLAFLTFLSHA